MSNPFYQGIFFGVKDVSEKFSHFTTLGAIL